VYVDGTFGAGGYTKAILEAADCRVISIDRDHTAIPRAQEIRKHYNNRLTHVHGTFGDVETHLEGLGIDHVDGFVLDIGVSSMQIDDSARGFSFMKDGPLDMRMDTTSGTPASVIVNTMDEKELANIIWKYGEEKNSRRIAGAILKARTIKPIETTLELAEIIRSCLPASSKKFAIHPATRTFQALRIVVNGELEQLERALEASKAILRENGRLVIVSFHSLEDSIVKAFFRDHGITQSGSRYLPEVENKPAIFIQTIKKSIPPSDLECHNNPRARSAKLRWGIRTTHDTKGGNK
jgi:16S rRNA (cytosine1402-N4)-methyltransferase